MTEEQLIEKMARAIHAGFGLRRNWDDLTNSDQLISRTEARVALAVVREHDADAIREALEPVLHWYQSDEHPDRSTAEIVRDIVADLQRDRAAVVRESEGWQPIETAPKHGEIEVRGDAGPYGISSWTGLAHWGLPTNWHRDNATWLSHAGAVLRLAGYYPREWRPIPPPPKTEGED